MKKVGRSAERVGVWQREWVPKEKRLMGSACKAGH